MKRLLFLLAAAAVLLSAAPSQAAWPDLPGRDPLRQMELKSRLNRIPDGHPRIFLREADLPALRARIAGDAVLAETYGRLLEWARSGRYYENLWVTGYQLEAAAFAYLVENRDPELLKRCLAIMDYLGSREVGRSNEHLKSWTAPIVSRGLAVAYDWLYPDLSEAQRRDYGQKAVEAAKVQYNLETHRHSDYNNHLYLEYGRGAFAGIALHGDGVDDAAAEQLALDGLELMLDHFIPAHNQVGAGDGGWHESMSYHAFFTYEFAHQLEAWSVALGEDLWDGFIGLNGDAAWLVYNTRPFDGSRVGVADIHTPSHPGAQIAAYMPLLERRLGDGIAGWLADHIRERDLADDSFTPHQWAPYLLWSDPSVRHVPPQELPTARIFRGLGWASMRSDWTPGAAFALFISGDYFAGHQHMDQNSFVLHRHAPLAIDAGEYGAKRTVYHNTVLIGDGQRYYGNDPRRFYAPTAPGSEFDTGDVLAFQTTDRFTYVAGDATNAHGTFENGVRTSQPVELARRQFLFLRPDLVVVYDRVVVKDADTPVTWLLHSEDPAEITGDLVIITNGKGRLFSHTLLPRMAAVTGEAQVGGNRNREDYVIRVPSPNARAHEFLHLLYATDASVDRMPVARALVDAEHAGVRITRGDTVATVQFKRRGDTGGSLDITEDGSSIGNWELTNGIQTP